MEHLTWTQNSLTLLRTSPISVYLWERSRAPVQDMLILLIAQQQRRLSCQCWRMRLTGENRRETRSIQAGGAYSSNGGIRAQDETSQWLRQVTSGPFFYVRVQGGRGGWRQFGAGGRRTLMRGEGGISGRPIPHMLVKFCKAGVLFLPIIIWKKFSGGVAIDFVYSFYASAFTKQYQIKAIWVSQFLDFCVCYYCFQ